MRPLSPIALVTGANRGIGFEVCRQLSESGMRVLLAARDPAKGEAFSQSLSAARRSAGGLGLTLRRRSGFASGALRRRRKQA